MQHFETSTDIKYERDTLSDRIRLFKWIVIICWTMLIAVSWFWNFNAEQKVFNKVALAEANAVIERDSLYRRWAANHGGVYVPVTDKTPPSPYLLKIPERDILTPSGKLLTIINPAYMVRQVNELSKKSDDPLGRAHLTSLKPMRPENAPDPWEASALRSFEKGTREISSVTVIDGKKYVRLMKAFITESPCMKCHSVQGYTVGSVRGGLSVSIPLQPLLDASHGQIVGSIVFHSLIWLLGMLMILMGGHHLYKSASAQKLVENELHQQTIRLEQEIAERQMAQEALEDERAHLQIVADYASNWEYWRLPDSSFPYISPSVVELTGYSVENFTNDHNLVSDIIHPDDRELFHCHVHKLGSSGQILPIEMRITHKCGDIRWISHVCQQVFTSEGTPWGWRASNQDITARKMMEAALFKQTKQLANEIAEREAAQKALQKLNHSLEERINLAIAELRHKDQSLIQQNRLATMGEMINNIAHQWRQPLNNVGLIIQNLQISYETDMLSSEEMTTEVEKAMAIIIHMSHTIDDFRNFFREDKQKEKFLVSTVIHNTLEFVSDALANRDIKVEVEEDHGVTAIGYQNEYAQVLLNILSNSREACIERGISTPRILIRINTENGRSVVYISDNCGGIRDDVMPKIFDPYFTTRAPDKGTGIGLYMSKVIIEQNMGGSLSAKNTNEGAEFRIEV